MACGDKIKNTCGESFYATCVDYEGTIGKYSKIDESCITLEDITEDLYSVLDDTIDKINTSNLGTLGISYPFTQGTIYPSTVLEVYEREITDLKSDLNNLNNLRDLNITDWGIDFSCLVNECQTPTVTLGDAVTNIARAICEGIVPPVFETQPTIQTGSFLGTDLILTRDNDTEIIVDASSVFDDSNLPRIVAGEVLGFNMVFTRDDSTQFGVDISNLINSPNDSSVVGGTVVGDNLILTKDDSTNITVDLSDFKENLPRILGMELSGNDLILTRDDSSTITTSLASLLDDTNLSRVTSGNIVGNDLILTRDDSSTVVIDVSTLAVGGADGNDFITGANLSGTTLNLTGTGGAGASVNLSSLSNTDSQTLSVSGSNLTISGGNTVTLPSGGGGLTETSGTNTITVSVAPGLLFNSSSETTTMIWRRVGNVITFSFTVTASNPRSVDSNDFYLGNLSSSLPTPNPIQNTAIAINVTNTIGASVSSSAILNTSGNISADIVAKNRPGTVSSTGLNGAITFSGSYITS